MFTGKFAFLREFLQKKMNENSQKNSWIGAASSEE